MDRQVVQRSQCALTEPWKPRGFLRHPSLLSFLMWRWLRHQALATRLLIRLVMEGPSRIWQVLGQCTIPEGIVGSSKRPRRWESFCLVWSAGRMHHRGSTRTEYRNRLKGSSSIRSSFNDPRCDSGVRFLHLVELYRWDLGRFYPRRHPWVDLWVFGTCRVLGLRFLDFKLTLRFLDWSCDLFCFTFVSRSF